MIDESKCENFGEYCKLSPVPRARLYRLTLQLLGLFILSNSIILEATMLVSEEDYKNFQQHLDAFRPAIAEFCASKGFEQVQAGRYPRIRIEKISYINQYIDLWMTFDEEGMRRTTFTPDTTYDLSAGVYFFIRADDNYLQCSKNIDIWINRRISEISAIDLIEDFRTAANLLGQLTLDDLLHDNSLVTCPVSTAARMTPPDPNE